MGVPLVKGRVFSESDGPDSPHVAVISQSLAAAKWPDADPVGRFVQFGNMGGDYRGIRIVGVVGDVRERSMETPPGSVLYVSYRQRPTSLWAVSVIVRGADGAAVIAQARRLVRELDPELPIQVRTVEDAFDAAVAGRRFSLVLIAVFGAAALLLATLGLYGLIAYLVAQRTREIGIRMALGATPRDLVRLIVTRGALLAAGGCAAGLAVSLILSRLVRGLLFGVSPTDPVVLGSVALVTIAASVAASCIPAWRAARVDPLESLRT
jgi:ABC-type antimicrobial peptide transport system permease subunit